MENSEHNDFLYSTHHFYKNEILNLTIDIQQAPYYTEYGFSIFLLSSVRQDSKLLCNVPHELQDKEDNFLISISDRFFTNSDVISLLKGESWKIIFMETLKKIILNGVLKDVLLAERSYSLNKEIKANYSTIPNGINGKNPDGQHGSSAMAVEK